MNAAIQTYETLFPIRSYLSNNFTVLLCLLFIATFVVTFFALTHKCAKEPAKNVVTSAILGIVAMVFGIAATSPLLIPSSKTLDVYLSNSNAYVFMLKDTTTIAVTTPSRNVLGTNLTVPGKELMQMSIQDWETFYKALQTEHAALYKTLSFPTQIVSIER